MAGGRFELAMEPMTIGLVSLNSNSETRMPAKCDVRLIYGRGWISRVFVCCAALIESSAHAWRWFLHGQNVSVRDLPSFHHTLGDRVMYHRQSKLNTARQFKDRFAF